MSARQHPEIIITADEQVLAAAAANRVLDRAMQSKARTAICLTGGSSAKRLYHLLATEPYCSRMSWERVHWFVGDDRFVPIDHPLSNMGMARRVFLDRVPAPSRNIHPIVTDMTSPDAAAQVYETELRHFYGRERLDPKLPLFDLVLMGLGTDGHTASLFPHGPALNERQRWVVGIEMAGLEPFVPRVTLTFPALASTREMLFLVSGQDKRDILARVLSGEDLPASRARSNGELVWLVDGAAAFKDRDATAFARG